MPSNTCLRSFDEALLTGYLDGALPQHQAQRVRLHLEDCESCGLLYKELETMRSNTLATHFESPSEEFWPELPQTRMGRFSRSFGWWLLISWLAVVCGIALWRFLSNTGDPLEIFLVLGFPGSLAFLFVSVLLDRLHDLKSDRYRGVHR